MVEMSSPLSVNSHHAIQLAARGQISRIEARVCHVRPAIDQGRYLVGLEFVTPAHVVDDEALGARLDKERV